MKAILWILSLAALWAITGAAAGWGLQAMFGSNSWIVPCGALNVAIGMILLQLFTQNEAARKLFYEGEKEEDHLLLGIVFLWGFPIILAFSGILWWLAGKLFPP